MIVLTDAEKDVDIIEHPFMIKTFNKLRIAVNAICGKPIANIEFTGKNLKSIPLKSGMIRRSIFSTLISSVLEF
jgi:hypothetical protein